MKSHALITIIIIIAILTSCKTSNIENNKNDQTRTDIEDVEYIWEKGIITWKPFVNKIGELVLEYGDYYFVYSEGEYFIKLINCNTANSNIKDFKNKFVNIKISTHDGLWDTNDPNIESRVGPYIIYDSIAEINEPIKIVYNDGNANAYIITPLNFTYNPGTYSGGEPRDFEINNILFNEIFIKAEQIATDQEVKINSRIKGSGFLKIYFKDSEIKAFIANSSTLADFDYYLYELK
ncbi:MAG: hypothetical protein PHW82_13205 [Bacteroidales bacterium]|nr:hypothetical protein [Bacteroidales bacterium]